MTPSKKFARWVGFLYLLIVPAGIFDLMYVPSKLIVKNDAAATAQKLLEYEWLFRLDLVIGLISTVIFIYVALGLYRLLRDVNPHHATAMAVLILISLSHAFVSELLWIAAFELARGAEFLAAVDTPVREALTLLCIQVSMKGVHLSEMFWGLWLFPLGILVYRSGFLPRFIGVWLILNCVGYVALSLTGILFPTQIGLLSQITMPLLFGEPALILWLLIMGVKEPQVAVQFS